MKGRLGVCRHRQVKRWGTRSALAGSHVRGRWQTHVDSDSLCPILSAEPDDNHVLEIVDVSEQGLDCDPNVGRRSSSGETVV